MTASVTDFSWWESPSMERFGSATASWAADMLVQRFGAFDVGGLYVATSDSGASESVDFWRSALDTGLDYASPKSFPWTLANSPTGKIAERLEIRGRTFTLIGGADALAAAMGHAFDDMDSGLTDALIVALDGKDRSTVALAAALLTSPGIASATPLSRPDTEGWIASEEATSALRRLIERLAGG